jgi:hypothetical protein
MSSRDPNKLAQFDIRLPTIKAMMKRNGKRPKTGLTQGGSGRRFAGAKQAATSGILKPTKDKPRER